MRIPVYTCDDCGAAMISTTQWQRRPWLRRRYRRHRARGLCNACYHRLRLTDALVDHERRNHATDETLDDWVILRDDGYSVRDAAARIGVTHSALDKALCRAKRRGDPRGSRVPFAHDMRQEAAS